MSIRNIKIQIIDTYENTLLNVVEATEEAAPSLNYSGVDNKFQHVMGSQLDFNFLVNDGSDGKFLHLFTGEENRYNVLLEDVTDENNPAILWNGFLLTEHYSEPYDGKTFFVNLQAVDGLGLLRTKYLPTSFYAAKKTIPAIIAECLALTGNDLPFSVAPAIENAVASFTLDKELIDTSIYKDDKNKKHSAYEVLEGVCKTLGCKLFQQNNQWYFVGFNRMHEIHLQVENYTNAGVYTNTTTVSRVNQIALFEGSPTITMVPPLKSVAVTWEPQTTENLLPEGVVSDSEVETQLPLYWNKVESSLNAFDYWIADSNGQIVYGDDSPRNKKDFNLTLYSRAAITDVTQPNNYVSLKDPVYIAATYENPFMLSVIMKVRINVYPELNSVDFAELNKRVAYEILLDGEIIVSNNISFDTNGSYDFEFSKSSETYLTGEIELENIPIDKNGYLDVKFYPAVYDSIYDSEISTIAITEFEINNAEDFQSLFETTRSINYTPVEDIEIPVATSQHDNVKNKIYIDESVPFTGFDVTYPLIDTNVPVLSSYRKHEVIINEFWTIDFWVTYITVSELDYHYLKQNAADIFIKRQGTGEIVPMLEKEFYQDEENDVYGLRQYENGTTNLFVDGDELYVKRTAYTETITDRHILMQYWQPIGSVTPVAYTKALAQAYHNTRPTPIKRIEGNLFGLAWPLTLLEFNYVNPVNYQLADLKLNLVAGETEVVLVEVANENITDYE